MTPLPYPHPRRLLWAARIVVVACALLAALIVIAGAGIWRAEPGGAGPASGGAVVTPALEAAALVLVAAFSAAVLAFLVFGFPLRCAACGHRVLAEWTGPREASARTVSGLNAWVATVLSILHRRAFRCVACGAEQTLDAPR